MKKRTFNILIVFLTVCGFILTAAHFIYAADAYQHCSVIEFIARELW